MQLPTLSDFRPHKRSSMMDWMPSMSVPSFSAPSLPSLPSLPSMDWVPGMHRRRWWEVSMPSMPSMPSRSAMTWTPWNRYEDRHSAYVDGALLLMRVGAGTLLAGHGAQKLFGWFGGHGLKGTGQWMESMGLEPGPAWAGMAAAGEAGGGLLMALGLGGSIGSIGVVSAMTMAWAKAHWGKPIWVTEGGAELPLAYATTAAAVALAGPGRYSLDHFLGIKLHWSIPAALAALAGITVAYGAMTKPAPQMQQEQPQPEGHPEEEAEQTPARKPVQLDEHRREAQRAA